MGCRARRVGPPLGSLAGVQLIFRLLRDAELALGEGDESLARERLMAAEPLVRVTGEAQWHGQYGSLMGELSRRGGELEEAQSAVARALDELEVCTDDVMRIARVTAVGAAVEADRALRARDLREPETENDALTRVRIHLDRLAAAAEDGGPVEGPGWRWEPLSRHARTAPTTPRSGRQQPSSGTHSGARTAPRRRAGARRRRWWPPSSVRRRPEVAVQALGVAERLGAGWLSGELQGLCARARLELAGSAASTNGNGSVAADDDRQGDAELPFGLTPRELQVLTLIAEGATNRQIGAALFMAEKTASVHVSRILNKLGVRSRTQAAAMAHRLHIT